MAGTTYIGLGSNCYVSWTLRRIGLQTESLPLDWMNSFDFSKIHPFLTSDPDDLLSDLAPSTHHLDKNVPLSLYSAAYDMRLPHEFDRQPEITLEGIRARYRRRIERLWRQVHAAERLVFVRALNDGHFAPRETFAEAVPVAQRFLDALSHLPAQITMILFSHNAEEAEDVGDYNIALIDQAVPMDCAFYQYGGYAISIDDADRFYRTFFWIPFRRVSDMAWSYHALAKGLGAAA